MRNNGGMAELPPSLLVYAAGGTIGMHDAGAGLVPDPAFPAALEELVAAVCTPLGVDFRINHQNPPIDSSNATAETAPRLAAAVRARARMVKPRGIVILHGTDTLAYTAARLAFEFDGLGVPVVFTGSQLPYGADASDARANLGLAIRTALRASPSAPVSIAFGGQLLPAVRATKHQSEAHDGFRAERPLAPQPAGVTQLERHASSDGAPRPAARIISFRFVPGVTTDDLRAAVGGEPDGLILECYGTGGAPITAPGMRDALRDVSASIPVVAVSQCATGHVDFNRYAVGRALQETGVIDGGDLTLEAAIGKLGWLTDRGIASELISEAMLQNLVGERSV